MTSSGIGKGKGRRKIKIEKIENKSNLIVTFSKRKGGLFKKAHELSILTGAEIAIILFSPGGKPYSFGHPAIEDVIDRFVSGSSIPLTSTQRITQAERNDRVVETNKKLAKLKEMIDFERKIKESLNTTLAEISNRCWGGINLEEQNLSIIQESIVVLKNTKAKVEREIKVRDLAKQNYNEPYENYSHYGIESVYLPFALNVPTYEGNGNTNTMTSLTQPFTYASGDGNGSNGNNAHGLFPSLMDHNINSTGVGGNSNDLIDSTGLGFYGNGGYWSLNCENNLFGDGNNRGGSFIGGTNSFIDVGGGNLPNTYEVSSFGQGNYGSSRSINDGLGPFRAGSRPFVDGSSSFVDGVNGDSLLNTNEFNSVGVEDGNGGECSNSWGSEWFGFIPPNELGRRYYPQP